MLAHAIAVFAEQLILDWIERTSRVEHLQRRIEFPAIRRRSQGDADRGDCNAKRYQADAGGTANPAGSSTVGRNKACQRSAV